MEHNDKGRVLVVGMGISGIATAARLHGAGWTPVIIERAPGRRSGGYMVALFGAGQIAAQRFGARPHARPHPDGAVGGHRPQRPPVAGHVVRRGAGQAVADPARRRRAGRIRHAPPGRGDSVLDGADGDRAEPRWGRGYPARHRDQDLNDRAVRPGRGRRRAALDGAPAGLRSARGPPAVAELHNRRIRVPGHARRPRSVRARRCSSQTGR
jgi:hypothetical protein